MRIVDMHCDTISALLEHKRAGEEGSLRENNGHIDLLRLRKSGYLLQNFALFVDQEEVLDPWEQFLALLELYEKEMDANQELIGRVERFGDIERNEKAGKLSALLTVEEGGVCRGDLDKLDYLYEKGVRMLTLTWNYPNELGYPNLCRQLGQEAWAQNRELKECGLSGRDYEERQRRVDQMLKSYLNTPETGKGLTERGREFVARMEELGMIPDVSHLSDAGFYDVLSVTARPFVASHSNARTVCPCVRNLTDDMIRKLAERGGVTGLNFCADFLAQKPAGAPNDGTIDDIVLHARHIVNVGGVECLGLGSDFDGIDTHQELPGAQKMGLLWDALERGGFTPSQIDKIFAENVLRLYRDVL